MPLYAYACSNCGHDHEALQKASDPVLTDCPNCNQSMLMRKLSAPNFRLKGGGWYETDFKSDNKRNLAEDASSTKDDKKNQTKDNDSGKNASENKEKKAKTTAESSSTKTTKEASSAKPSTADTSSSS